MDAVVLTLNIILICLVLTNIFLHSIGITVLNKLERDGGGEVQNIYIKSLSLAELSLNIVVLLDRLLPLLVRDPEVAELVLEIDYYLCIISFTGIALVYYLFMFCITWDKVLEVYLNIKYTIYWNERKAKRLVRLTWVVGLSMSIGFCFAHAFADYRFEFIFALYIFPTLNFLFIIAAVLTYSYIFYKYRQTRSHPSMRQLPQLSSVQIFRTSRFSISVWLVLSFLLCIVIPSLMLAFKGVSSEGVSPVIKVIIWIFYGTSTLADAFIYIFLLRKNRRLFCKIFRVLHIFERKNSNVIRPAVMKGVQLHLNTAHIT